MLNLLDDTSPAEVLPLGTPHLANPGRDLINVRPGDMLAPHRQHELEDLASRLSAFVPTKLCVELTPDRQDRLDELFADYLSGKGEVQPDEIYQIAPELYLP